MCDQGKEKVYCGDCTVADVGLPVHNRTEAHRFNVGNSISRGFSERPSQSGSTSLRQGLRTEEQPLQVKNRNQIKFLSFDLIEREDLSQDPYTALTHQIQFCVLRKI